jgi:exodeoxyribonuclease VII small subunit
MGKKVLKYSESLAELNTILEDMESETIEVDDLTEKVKRASELIQLCRSKLDSTELEVKKIVKEFEEKK